MAACSSRRQFLRNAAQWAGVMAAALAVPRRVIAAPIFLNDPFQLGVASGDPTADGFVLWTRLAPDPLDRGALPSEAIAVGWEIATDAV
ncbi:MAG: PhoD-like phosphatase N-terminal domain-containing protein, partial [Rhodospirillaceae bacterium]